MVHRAIHISSSFTIMHKEFDFIRDIAKRNGYPKNFVECQIRHTLNRYIEKQNIVNKDIKINQLKQQQDNNETHTDRIVINVPYVGKATQQFSKEINKLAKKVKPTTQVITVSRLPLALSCKTCSAKYIGKTVRQVCRRLKEHGAPTNITTMEPSESDTSDDEEINPETTITSAIQRHITSTNHKMDWNNWSILDRDNHPYRLLVKESLAINENSPSLNRTTRSIPLVVYPEGSKKRTTHNKIVS
ncbi:unnamed protein product [Rotaria sp. Silwood2]|nr:unnamed protein product [Rotaria sp. Silwood2]CAF4730963.1 unnamed protein product [Rotaria sp. Silwood2]